MAQCSCRPFVNRNSEDICTSESDAWKTSYDRSYIYSNVVDQTFVHGRVKRRIPDGLKIQDPSILKTPETLYRDTFVPKYSLDYSTDYCRRSGLIAKDTLKSLQDKIIVDPPRPLKTGATTTGSTYVLPKKIHEPKKWCHPNPTEEFTCKMAPDCREGLPSCSPTESGYTKYLDPYATTSQLTHCAFTKEQQNGLARKNVMTFYDALDLPKLRGFGPKKIEPFGPYFHRDRVVPYRVARKMTSGVPYFGKTSTYASCYDFVPTNLTNCEDDVHFPALYKNTEDSSYCTEQCHMGTGWPVRGELNIGTVSGTY